VGQFSAGSVSKAVPSFRKKLKEYAKAGRGHFQHLLQLGKCLHTFTVSNF